MGASAHIDEERGRKNDEGRRRQVEHLSSMRTLEPEPEPERLLLGAVVDELEEEEGGEWKSQWELDGLQSWVQGRCINKDLASKSWRPLSR